MSYFLVNTTGGGGGGGSLNFITDSGTAIPVANEINVLAGSIITTSGSGNTITIGLTGPWPVTDGGTGNTSFTDNAVIVGNGSSALSETNVGTNGQVLLGATGAEPAFATLTSTGGSITFTTGANTLNLEAVSSALTWNNVTSTSASMAVDNGYLANNAALVTLTLPATAAFGTIIEVAGYGAGGWRIAQNSGQTIHFLGVNTTTGATGRLDSNNIFCAIRILCTVADTDWTVLSSSGNIDIT